MPDQPQLPNRRDFAKKLAVGAGAIIAGGGAASAAEKLDPENRRKPLPTRPGGKGSGTAEPGKGHMRTEGSVSSDGKVFQELGRDIPVAADYDVIVVGGGRRVSPRRWRRPGRVPRRCCWRSTAASAGCGLRVYCR